jgi:DNA-directed RNA polymerase specialized sigma subunit
VTDNQIPTNYFHLFVENMNDLIAYNTGDNGLTQLGLFERLVAEEDKFRKLLLSSSEGRAIYGKFMAYINEVKGNLLSAQVYFRERQKTLNKKMSRSFERNKPELLHDFHVNYRFVKWALENYNGFDRKKLTSIFKQIHKFRKILLENNLPLAINRANRFAVRVPEVHLNHMDYIQNASEGLLDAIDKFVVGDSAFGAVAVGRITLRLMTDQNSTLIKMSPKDKRMLYRANMIRNRTLNPSDKQIVTFVKEKFDGATIDEINGLSSAAANMTSLEYKEEDTHSIMDISAGGDDVEKRIVENDLHAKLRKHMSDLSVLEQKIIKLKYGFSEDT